MRYITSIERREKERGFRQGVLVGIELCLQLKLGASQSCRFTPLMNGSIYALSISKKYSCNFEMLPLKFGSEGLEVFPEVSQIEDIEILKDVLDSIKRVPSLQELRLVYQSRNHQNI